ncbi:MAG: hypothetical protein M3Q81_00880, partial [bacterium]|nr:hypothetical protein [bacterium]
TELRPKIPPAYSILIGITFFVLQQPLSFYYLNLMLLLSSTVFLYLAVKNLSPQRSIQLLSMLLWGTHLYLQFFTTLAMAENLGILLMTITLWLITKGRTSLPQLIALAIISWLFVLTKYIYLPIALVIGVWSIWQMRHSYTYKQRGAWLTSHLIAGAVFLGYLVYINFNPLSAFSAETAQSANAGSFFSLSPSLLITQSLQYLKSLIGVPITVLWMRYPLTSPGLGLITSVLFLVAIWQRKVFQQQILFTTTLLLSPIVLLQFFYVVDGRYLLTAVPAVILVLIQLLVLFEVKTSQLPFKVLFIVLVLSQLISQSALIKNVIATNWLQRSNAWQYAALKEYQRVIMPKGENYFITALPPYLIELYQDKLDDSTILPLSQHQEFLDKKQFVWGSDIGRSNLSTYYQSLLLQSKAVYITNAYITHNAMVVNDYEELKNTFVFIEVSRGCSETCNIYQLSLKPADENTQ